MKIIPLSIAEAEKFLESHGRHYVAPAERICAIGVGEEESPVVQNINPITGTKMDYHPVGKMITPIHGAAILGRNEAGEAELAHIYVDGVSQGYSLLYGAVWRAFKALGYRVAVL